MRSYALFLSLILMLILLVSCSVSPPQFFGEPQPQGVKNKRSFKKKYTGIYQCMDDSVKIIVSDERVVRRVFYREKESKEKVDSMRLEIRDGYLIFPGDLKEGKLFDSVPVRFFGDSMEVVINETDTLFDRARGDILRYYKKKYYLNTPAAHGFWTVRTLGFENSYTNNGADRVKVLAVRRFYAVEKKDNLLTRLKFEGEINGVDLGDLGNAIEPTRKQLQTLMSTKAYRREYKCVKIKPGKKK